MPWRVSPLVYGSTSDANGYGLALHDHGLVHEPRLVRSHLHVPRYCRWAPLAHTQLQPSTLDPASTLECQPRLPTREHCTSFSHTRRSGRYPPGVSSVLTRHAATATKQPASSLPCLDSFGPLNHSTYPIHSRAQCSSAAVLPGAQPTAAPRFFFACPVFAVARRPRRCQNSTLSFF